VLIFEEVRSPITGAEADADPSHRHAVRLLTVEYTNDDLDPQHPGSPIPVIEISWAAQDALPFSLCLEETEDGLPISVARGNVVLADHGRTISKPEELPEVIAERPYRPLLADEPVTQQGRARTSLNELALDENNRSRLFDPSAPAAAVMQWEMSDVLPAIYLQGDQDVEWLPQYDLLNSGRFAAEFVVETEEDGRAQLRFGDGILGRLPVSGLTATYRSGNGRAGNVGAEAIANVITNKDGITRVRNPLPARGGREPETLDQVRFSAPQAFRTQQRAVTEADYAEMAERHPEVQKATATRRWTGSWYTMFVTIDRIGGREVDEKFRDELKVFLDRFRMAGYDLEINAPIFVSLDIALTVCVKPDYFQGNVKEALLEVFSNRDLPGGGRGFFHPDNFTFGQPVYLSQIVAAAMQVPGVLWVDADNTPPRLNRFQRWGQLAQKEVEDGYIKMNRLEIARLDNDPSLPENGKIEFFMKGGM